jgi:hypothetical protein
MSIDFPKEEEEILQRWKKIKAFETQVELSKSRPLYTFYDGPPFATLDNPLSPLQKPLLTWRLLNQWTPALWPSPGIYDQRYNSEILVYEGLPRRETIWVGYTWNSY